MMGILALRFGSFGLGFMYIFMHIFANGKQILLVRQARSANAKIDTHTRRKTDRCWSSSERERRGVGKSFGMSEFIFDKKENFF